MPASPFFPILYLINTFSSSELALKHLLQNCHVEKLFNTIIIARRRLTEKLSEEKNDADAKLKLRAMRKKHCNKK